AHGRLLRRLAWRPGRPAAPASQDPQGTLPGGVLGHRAAAPAVLGLLAAARRVSAPSLIARPAGCAAPGKGVQSAPFCPSGRSTQVFLLVISTANTTTPLDHKPLFDNASHKSGNGN